MPAPSSSRLRALLLAAGAAMMPVHQAQATWSIILVDTRTGEIAVGSATCLSNFDLRAGTPILIPGLGAATAQSFVDSTGQNRVFVRDRLIEGLDPQQIIGVLVAFDAGHQTRQYGIANLRDGTSNTVTFSGTGANAWAGGQTGEFVYTHAGQQGTIAYAIQGNILTGAPVVQQAVEAVISTPGDLTARMMAGMQAARAMGGDGRCSCPGNPTGCGAPPPSFSKSAHIAYMLTARAGDREGSNGIYRAGNSPTNVAAGDIDGDGRADIITANAASGTLSISRNTTLGFIEQQALFAKFQSLPTNLPTGASPRGIAAGDLNGDSHADIVVSNINSGTITIYRGDPTSTTGFGAAETRVVGAAPRAVRIANLDGQNGPDIITINSSEHAAVVLFNDGAGGFAQPQSFPVDTGPQDIVVANLVGGPGSGLDLAVACRSSNRLVILAGNGQGGFTQASSTPMLAGAVGMITGDFDGDGIVDLAVACDTSQRVQVFLNNGQGELTAQAYIPGLIPSGIAGGDVNGDGMPDVVISSGNRFAVMLNDGQGGLTLDRTYTIAGTASGLTLADFDNDGDLDIALANAGLTSTMIVQNLGPGPREGEFNDGIGCATGEYFLNLNVAFQSASAPDPVVQLQEQYNAWRTSLVGRPDAVQSRVALDPPSLPANGAATSTMTITLRDWLGEIITAPITSITIEPAPGSAPVAATPPVHQGGGIWNSVLTAGNIAGEVRLRITVDDGQRPVVLMPEPVLILGSACYANCDESTVAPKLNVDDFTCFINQFAAASALPQAQQVESYANCDESTVAPVLNVDDFTCFINRYAAGCP
jgi:hypothetical protein